jgi:hypothetical protein
MLFAGAMATAADRFARRKPIESLGSGVPKLDWPIQSPRKHRLMGYGYKVGETLYMLRSRLDSGRFAFV